MKVLHINTSLSGGAALCAKRIANALELQGVECCMLVANDAPNENDDVSVVKANRDRDCWYSNPISGKIKHLLNRMPWYEDAEKMEIALQGVNSKLPQTLYLHQPYSYYKNIAHHPLMDWADVIHLHWVADLVDYPSFFKQIKKPIVWTLHDMYPAIGAMHFISGNTPLPEIMTDLEFKFRKIKRKAVMHCEGNMHVVAISELMRQCVNESDVLRGFPVTLIHNGVDTTVFQPIDIKYRQNVFLFSSYDIWDKRKGLSRVIAALEKTPLSQKRLIVIGQNNRHKRPSASFPIEEVGLIRDEKELARLYSQADFFINASYEEAFAQTPLEAMACGTPVISTPCSGAADLIRPFNGVICKGFDADTLALGISEALNKVYNSETIRQYIIDNYKMDVIAKQYMDLYDSVRSN